MPIPQLPIAFGPGDFLLCRRPGPSSFVEDSIRPCTFGEREGRCHSKRLARVRRWSTLPAQLALESTLSSLFHQSSKHESRPRSCLVLGFCPCGRPFTRASALHLIASWSPNQFHSKPLFSNEIKVGIVFGTARIEALTEPGHAT